MNCTNPYIRVIGRDLDPLSPHETSSIPLPCGKCLACRINRRREWTQRLLHESYFSDTCYFITLTYSDENLPFDKEGLVSVSKKDIQKFIQDLRNEYRGVKIRYFIGSEYGSEEFTNRPHYHGILYNVPDDILRPCDDFQKGMQLTTKKHKYISYVNRHLNDIWKKGFCTIGEMCRERASYCAKYFVDKKDSPEGHEPNFSLMSRRPGIGYEHAMAIKDKVRYVNSHSILADNGKYVTMPRYYDKKIYSDEERAERLSNLDISSYSAPIIDRISTGSMDVIDRQIKRHHSYKNLKKQL